MIKNMSWGTGIATLYIGFVLMIILMVTMSVMQKIDLVGEDYYEREIAFQDRIDAMKNAIALPEKINHNFTEKGLEVKFPMSYASKAVSGEIVFFKPSDAKADDRVQINLNSEGIQCIDVNKFSKGMYKMQISWTMDAKPYYYELIVVVP